MGTHPSLPSKEVETGRTLKELVSENESLLAPTVVGRFGTGKLPFLFKVLSINKALSIQAHPDKRLAERLHADDPKNYPGMQNRHIKYVYMLETSPLSKLLFYNLRNLTWYKYR